MAVLNEGFLNTNDLHRIANLFLVTSRLLLLVLMFIFTYMLSRLLYISLYFGFRVIFRACHEPGMCTALLFGVLRMEGHLPGLPEPLGSVSSTTKRQTHTEDVDAAEAGELIHR